jgi:hypothetical protein
MTSHAQHALLTRERWSSFGLDQQILMIGNEMNRARKLMAADDRSRLQGCYERVLRLTDLTVAAQSRPNLRRELLRWRDLIALLYLAEAAAPEQHDAAFLCLLQLTPVASEQIPYVLPTSTRNAP